MAKKRAREADGQPETTRIDKMDEDESSDEEVSGCPSSVRKFPTDTEALGL